MSRDRKILLIILVFSMAASLSAINLLILSDRSSRARSGIEQLEPQYLKLHGGGEEVSAESIDALKSMIDMERSRFFPLDETDPYLLGIKILGMLEKRGIKVGQYKTLELEGGFLLEFSVRSRSSSLFSFWEDLYGEDKYYRIPYLSINNEKDGVSCTFRIGYAVYE